MGDRRAQGVGRGLGPEHHEGVLLAPGLEPVLGQVGEGRVAQHLPELVDVHNQPAPVDAFGDAVKQIEDGRGADLVVIQQLGDVEAREARVQGQGVLVIVEHPAQRSAALPAFQPGPDAAGVALAEQAAQGGDRAAFARQGLQRRNALIYRARLGHVEGLVRPRDEGAHQPHQKGAIGGRRSQGLEGGEAGRLAVAQRQIGPAAGAHEQFGAAVLIDEQLLGVEPFELGQHEVLHHSLAGAGRAADEGVAEIADVEVEVEGRAGGGAQGRHRLAPVVAARLADRMGVEGRKRREIARGDGRGPGAAREIAGELGPERRLQTEVLARHDQAGVRQDGAGARQMIGQGRRGVAVHQHRGVVFAHDEPVADQVVERLRQACDLGGGAVARGDHLVLFALHHGPGGGLGQEGEGLAGDEVEPGAEQGVPKARAGRRRIFLDGQDAGVTGVRDVAQFQRLAAEDGADGVDRRSEMAVDEGDGGAAAGQHQPHHLQRFGEPQARPLGQAQPPRGVTAEVLDQIAPGLLEAANVVGQRLGPVPPGRFQPLHQGSGAVSGVPAGMQDEGDEQFVDPQRALGDPRVIGRAQFGGEGRAIAAEW